MSSGGEFDKKIFENAYAEATYMWINSADESYIRSRVESFTPYIDKDRWIEVVPMEFRELAESKLKEIKVQNRPIGIWNNLEVWVKPDAMAEKGFVIFTDKEGKTVAEVKLIKAPIEFCPTCKRIK